MQRQSLVAVMIAMIIMTPPAHAADSYVLDSRQREPAALPTSALPASALPTSALASSAVASSAVASADAVELSVHSHCTPGAALQDCALQDCALQDCVPGGCNRADRLWLMSTRHLCDQACFVDLQSPALSVARLDGFGNAQPESLDVFFSQLSTGRPLVIHVHGNRMTSEEAGERGRFIYRNLAAHLGGQPIDFMIFSWPSERSGVLVRDGREKAERTEAEALYFAWLLRELVVRNISVTVIGYSFGGRVATGGLHVLAGGWLGGRQLPGQTIRGAKIAVGLVAPALAENALASGQYHGLASQNIRKMALFYNSRDVILKRYWLIDVATRGRALGYTGPKRLAPGVDGNPVQLFARDCAPFLGVRHSEIEYYTQGCRAGRTMASLVGLTTN